MTTTIDERAYAEILGLELPHVIRSEEDNQKTLLQIESLLQVDNRSSAQSELLQLLLVLVERFEEEQYALPRASPAAALHELLEARGLKQRDIADLFSSKSNVSEILSGKRAISKDQAKRLAEFFHVPVSLFI